MFFNNYLWSNNFHILKLSLILSFNKAKNPDYYPNIGVLIDPQQHHAGINNLLIFQQVNE